MRAEVILNQVLVGFDDVDARDVIAAVQREGTCWMSGTTWRGERLMRISVSNWQTDLDDVGPLGRRDRAVLRGAARLSDWAASCIVQASGRPAYRARMDGPEQRIGDTERDHARAVLQRHTTVGRLTLDELSDRLDEGQRGPQATDSSSTRCATCPRCREPATSCRRLETWGACTHRGTLSRREFAGKKHDLLAGLAAIAADEVPDTLDALNDLRNHGWLTSKEFASAKRLTLPMV